MRRALILLVLLCIAGGLCGCPSLKTSEQKWAAATALYNSTLRTLNDLHDAGVLTEEQKAKIEPYRAMAAAALDRMEAALQSDASDFEAAWDVFSTAMDVLIEEAQE